MRNAMAVLGAMAVVTAPGWAQGPDGQSVPAGQSFTISIAGDHAVLRFDDQVEAAGDTRWTGMGWFGPGSGANGEMISWGVEVVDGRAQLELQGSNWLTGDHCDAGWPLFEVGEQRSSVCWLEPDLGGGRLGVTIERTQ